MTRRRVVITGLGMLSPLGTDVASTWEGILAGRSGIRQIDHFDTENFSTKFAGLVPDFAMDGILPPDKEFVMCLSNNGEFNFANIDAENDFENRSTDWSAYDCDAGTIDPIFP